MEKTKKDVVSSSGPRELMHRNYNGGWHGEGDTNEAFHHGMDVGYDIAAQHFAPKKETNP